MRIRVRKLIKRRALSLVTGDLHLHLILSKITTDRRLRARTEHLVSVTMSLLTYIKLDNNILINHLLIDLLLRLQRKLKLNNYHLLLHYLTLNARLVIGVSLLISGNISVHQLIRDSDNAVNK